jgi:hypothetical protein
MIKDKKEVDSPKEDSALDWTRVFEKLDKIDKALAEMADVFKQERL